MSTLLTAARSYYGLADTKVVESELVSQAGTYITFRIEVTDEDLAGILARMKTMQEQAPAQPKQDETQQFHDMNLERTRVMYNALTPAERSKFGSFARYVGMGGVLPDSEQLITVAAKEDLTPMHVGAGGRKIVHVDAPEEESAKPEMVWIDQRDATVQQHMMASDTKTDKNDHDWLLLQVCMLTPEQRARYVQPGEQNG